MNRIGRTFLSAFMNLTYQFSESSRLDPNSFVTDPPVDAALIRTGDTSARLEWTWDADSVEIYDADTATPRMTVSQGKSVQIDGLDPMRRHLFALHFRGGAHDGERLYAAERVIPLASAINLRDIGGYRTEDGKHTRWGVVYRSGELARMTAADQRYLRDALKIRLVCDFRSREELVLRPDPDFGARLEHLPVGDPQTQEAGVRSVFRSLLLGQARTARAAFGQSYFGLIDEAADTFGAAIARTADRDALPLLIHCTAGKDRTGITSALLLSLLGVPDATIVADYSLTNRAFADILGVTGANPAIQRAGIPVKALTPIIIAEPLWIEAALAHVREKYGSVEGYLRDAAGVTDAQIAAIRANLLTA